MRLRPATPDDWPAIREIAYRTWPVTFGDILTPEQIDYMLARMYTEEALRDQTERQGHRYLIGFAEGDTPALPEAAGAVGYVSYQLDYLPHVVKIHKLYVLPEAHGRGLGREFVSAVAKLGGEARQRRLRLDVNRHNPAVGFYERMGFTKVDEVVTEIGRGYVMDDFVYEIGL